MEKNLTLTVMMGVGKTTIGKRIAKKLNYNFIDIDKIIEKKENQPISFIFKNKGEHYFRKIEKEIAISEIKKKESVISLGGGAFLNSAIRKITKKLSISFWLDIPFEKLESRLKKSRKRPLINRNNSASIKKIYFQRKKFYNQATFKVNCKSLTVREITDKIIRLYEKSRN